MEKKTPIFTHKRHFKPISRKKSILLIVLLTTIIVLLHITTVIAADWDNAKLYDPETRTATIKNAFGLGSTVADIKLLTPSEVWVEPGKDIKVAEFEINVYGSSYDDALKEMNFYNMNKDMTKKDKDFEYRQRIAVDEILVDDYDYVCNPSGTYVNGSERYICTNQVVGSHLEIVYDWVKLKDKNLEPGNIVIGIFTDVGDGDKTEWIPTFFGVEIPEWASFFGSTRYEWYIAGDNDQSSFSNTNFVYQTFTVGTVGTNENFNLVGVAFKGYEDGGSGMEAHLFALNGTGWVGSDAPLASNGSIDTTVLPGNPGGWMNVTMSSYELQASTQYAIGFNGTAAGNMRWRMHNAGGTYGGGNYMRCTSGNWYQACSELATNDFMFEIWGGKATVPPVVTHQIPANDTNFTIDNSNIQFNCTSSDVSGVLNLTLAINDVANITITNTTAHENLSIQDNVNFSAGTYNWSCFATDSEDLFVSTSNRSFTVYKYLALEEDWDRIVTEGTEGYFNLNITTAPSTSLSTARVYYNNTFYTAGSTASGENYTLSINIRAPDVAATTNHTFKWVLDFADGSQENTTEHEQQVEPFNIDDCTSYAIKLMNISLWDEITLDLLNETNPGNNTLIEVDLQITPAGSTESIINYSNNFTQDNNPQICLEKDLGTGTYRLDTLIQYDGDAYAKEFYNIQNYSLVNSSLPRHIVLLDLEDALAQEFKIIYKDSNFLPVEDALIQIQRKYIADGVFRTAEIPKTDTNGETVASLQLTDTIYTIFVTKNGVTLATFEDVLVVCQNPALDDCILNLNQFGSSITLEDYTIGDDFTFTLTHNKTSRVVTTVFSIPSGSSSTVLLNVTLLDGLGTNEACSDSLNTASGTLTCTIPQNLGNGTAIATVYKDGTQVGQAFIKLAQEPSDLYGDNLVFLALFLILTLIGLGVSDNPMMSAIFVAIGGILLIALNFVSTGSGGGFVGAGATVLWLFIALILVLVKGSRRT